MIVLGANLAQNPSERIIRRMRGPDSIIRGGYWAERDMPSLLRFLAVVGIIAGIGYGVIFALAYLVDPKPREISVTVPADRFYKQR